MQADHIFPYCSLPAYSYYKCSRSSIIFGSTTMTIARVVVVFKSSTNGAAAYI